MKKGSPPPGHVAQAGKKGRRTSGGGGGFSSTWIIIAVVALLAIGTVVALSVRNVKNAPCTPAGQHEHASFAVWANGSEYRWLGPQFDYPYAGALEGHIHQPQSQTVHMESGTRCITVASFFKSELQSILTTDSLQLDTLQHAGATFHDGQGGHLRFFLGKPPAGWIDNKTRSYLNATEVNWAEESNLPAHQPRDGEYFLVDFGNDDAQTIQAHESAIPRQDRSEGGSPMTQPTK